MPKLLKDNWGLTTPKQPLSQIDPGSEVAHKLLRLMEGLSAQPEEKRLWGVGPIPMQKCDKASGNGRYYPLSLIKTSVTEAQDRITNFQCIGELDHGGDKDDPFPRLKEASHVVTKLWLDEDSKEVWGKAAILPTPNGEILHTLLESGVSVGVSVRGVGSVSKKVVEGNQVDFVDDFKIITYEFVSWAGFPELITTRKDMKKIESLSESLKRPLDKLNDSQRNKLVNHLIEIRLKDCSPMEKLILLSELFQKI